MGLARKLALFAPLAAFVAATNYFVDPGNLFGTEAREAQVARALSKEERVPAGFALDELRLQQLLAQERKRPPDVLVLGSSRSMIVSKEAFANRDVANASVSSASLENVIVLFELYERHGLRPRHVFLAVDPWALSGGLRNPSVSLDAELPAALRRLGRPTGVDYGAVPAGVGFGWRWLRLASPAYFQASFATLVTRSHVSGRAGTDRGPGPSASAAPEDRGFILADGSREWPLLAEARETDAVEAIAVAEAARASAYELAPPVAERLLLLQAFLDDVASRGVRVLLWLPPYHPAAYARLVAGDRARGLAQGEAALRALAEARGLPVLGSYDPAVSEAEPGDFIDHHHLRRAAANRLLARQTAEARVFGPSSR